MRLAGSGALGMRWLSPPKSTSLIWAADFPLRAFSLVRLLYACLAGTSIGGWHECRQPAFLVFLPLSSRTINLNSVPVTRLLMNGTRKVLMSKPPTNAMVTVR